MNVNNLGELGEEIAALYLKKKGYIIFKRNYHSRYGEIDIVAEKDNLLAFVEVKARTAGAIVTGAEAVDGSKQNKIRLTAKDFLKKTLREYDCRFDVCEITFDKSAKAKFSINYIENAFM